MQPSRAESTQPALARAPRGRGRRRWLTWTLTIALGLPALGLLGVTVAAHVARGVVGDRLVALGAERGLTLTWAAIDLPLTTGATVRDLRIASAADGRTLAVVSEVVTDVSLMAAIGGKRRPDAVTLRGLDAHVSVVDGRLVGLEGLRGPPADAADEAPSATAPLRVTIDGGRATIDVSAFGAEAERVELSALAGELTRGADRALSFVGRADVRAGEHSSAATLRLEPGGAVTLDFAQGFQLGAATPKGPVWLGLAAIARDPATRRTTVAGLALRRGDDRVTVGRVTIADAGEGSDAGAGLAPRPRDVSGVTLDDVAIERDDARLVAAHVEVDFGPPSADGLPVPTGIRARDIGAESTGRQVKGTFGEATVTLTRPLEALRAGRPLDAIGAVTLGRPRITATIGGEGGGDDPDGLDALIARVMGGGGAADAGVPSDDPPGDDLDGAPPSDPRDAQEGGARARLKTALALLRAWQPSVEDGLVDVRGADGATLLSLEGLSLRTREVGEGLLELGVRAAVHRGGEETGQVDADVGFDGEGDVVYANGGVSGKDLAHQISRFLDHFDVQPDAHVDLRFNYTRPIDPEAPHRVKGRAHLRQFSFQYWRVADTEVKDLEGEVTFDLAFYRKDHRVILDLSEIRFGEARLNAALDVTRRPGEKPRFDVRVTMPSQDCGAVARSIPQALIPRLSTLRARGRMHFDARLSLDLADPYGLELKVDGSLDACEVSSLGPGVNLERLKGRFVHVPLEPERGRIEHIRVGRGTREWIPSEELPEIVKATAWITEDRRYFDHGGVRWDLIARAMKMDIEHQRFIYGGSTVTQQLVKNLYLDRGKSLARKLEEAIIAWQMERVLTKDEILTIYVNVIEYGPDIYGVKHAARHYFGKAVDELDPLEVAFIMGLKPYPHRGYLQWERGTLQSWWIKRVKKVLEMVAARSDTITRAEADAYGPDYAPRFRPHDEAIDPALRRPTLPAVPDPEEPAAWEPW